MKRMWMWVAVAIVVGVLILGATKGKWCGKANKPLGRWSDGNRQAYADYYKYDPLIGPAPPGM